MDTIFFNGCIRTLDNSEKVAEAVGIENGRIVFVGTDKEAEAFSCKKRIDLKGRLMLPGFVDTHMYRRIQCLSPAKKYKLYKSSINKSLHFVQRSLSSGTRWQRVTAQLNLSRE